ncbi:cystathionine beta-synthase [Chelonus insularis]|uniref:cystathionine beta-synthase n=1 Tax=Chelonus insularis TaxID=460826 RepID=UPI00158B88C9|nr:cystathionine beta-synthase [Chelonus insularis]
MEDHPSNAPSRCTWTPNGNNPHIRRNVFNDRKKVQPNILELIGQTPMVKLNKVPRNHGVQCEIFAKCEYLNPGGSVKDRIAYRMIQDAEEKGFLKPGYTIIEPTSGNTGIGLAMAAAARGYRCIIVMPQKMSNEKLYTLRILGAEIIRTPTEAAWDSPESHISVAERLRREIPNSIILNQYINSGNPLAHYDQTAEEIWQQTEGKIDYFVAGAGTGGTITGIGRRLRELSPKTKLIAIDPVGSILAEPAVTDDLKKTFYDVEGVGYDFIPTVLDHNVIDEWIKCSDSESFNMARELIKEEGLLCGGSSGSAVVSALKFAKSLSADKRVVVLLPDGIRNYMTKFVSDTWMVARGYMTLPAPEGKENWWNNTISKDMIINPDTLPSNITCKEAYDKINAGGTEFLLIVDNNKVKGYITLQSIRSGILNSTVQWSDKIDDVMIKQFYQIPNTATVGRVVKVLEEELFVVIVEEMVTDDKFIGIITQKNIFDIIN